MKKEKILILEVPSYIEDDSYDRMIKLRNEFFIYMAFFITSMLCLNYLL